MTLATPETLGLAPLPEEIEIEPTRIPDVEWTTTDGVFIKQMYIRNAGAFVRQHAHTHDHTSMLATGAVFVWCDGKLDKQYHAPAILLIKAGVWHTFQALKNDTLIYCIHRLGNEILEKHGLTEDDLTAP